MIISTISNIIVGAAGSATWDGVKRLFGNGAQKREIDLKYTNCLPIIELDVDLDIESSPFGFYHELMAINTSQFTAYDIELSIQNKRLSKTIKIAELKGMSKTRICTMPSWCMSFLISARWENAAGQPITFSMRDKHGDAVTNGHHYHLEDDYNNGTGVRLRRLKETKDLVKDWSKENFLNTSW